MAKAPYFTGKLLISDADKGQLPPERIIPKPGIRARLKWWFEHTNQEDADRLIKSLGMSVPMMSKIIYGGKMPSVREAMCIEVLTDGQCPVYDWCMTMDFQKKSFDAVRAQTNIGINNIARRQWPPVYARDLNKHLRNLLLTKLSRPTENILAIVVHMGEHKIRRARRIQALRDSPVPLPVVRPEATDEEVERELYFYHRRLSKRAAFKAGTRSDF